MCFVFCDCFFIRCIFHSFVLAECSNRKGSSIHFNVFTNRLILYCKFCRKVRLGNILTYIRMKVYTVKKNQLNFSVTNSNISAYTLMIFSPNYCYEFIIKTKHSIWFICVDLFNTFMKSFTILCFLIFQCDQISFLNTNCMNDCNFKSKKIVINWLSSVSIRTLPKLLLQSLEIWVCKCKCYQSEYLPYIICVWNDFNFNY